LIMDLLKPYRFYFQNFSLEVSPIIWIIFTLLLFSFGTLFYINFRPNYWSNQLLKINFLLGLLLIVPSSILAFKFLHAIISASLMDQFDPILYDALRKDLYIVIFCTSAFFLILAFGIKKLIMRLRRLNHPSF
jgi:hypothetical protein